MIGRMWGLLAETSLHYGVGSSMGAVDLPVAREATTSYPVIFGSGMKGALLEHARHDWGVDDSSVAHLFGSSEAAGSLAVTDGRLLLLPVRSLLSHYYWVTCPLLVERWDRDRRMVGLPALDVDIPSVDDDTALMVTAGEPLFLEEIELSVESAPRLEKLAEAMAKLVAHGSTRSRLRGQLVVVSDRTFCYFATNALPVVAHNQLNDKTKASQNLWFEETLPPDTLLYTVLAVRDPDRALLDDLQGRVRARPYLRVGANETVGQGWCIVQPLEDSHG